MVKRELNDKEIWLGHPLSKNPRAGFFFDNSKRGYPVRMFADDDRDGVPNIMDCQPKNPNKQGFIDAVVGAVKGMATKGGAKKYESVKQGWSEGMAKKGNPMSRAISKKYTEERKHQRQEKIKRFVTGEEGQRQKELYQYLSGLPGGQNVATPVQAWENRGVKRELRNIKIDKKIKNTITGAGGWAYNKFEKIVPTSVVDFRIVKGHPDYERNQRIREYREKLKRKDLTDEQRLKTERLLAQVRAKPLSDKRKFYERAIETAIPIPSMTSYKSSGKRIQGIPGRGRGRPRGTLDKRYAAYGGVYGWRRYLSEQKKLTRFKVQQQKEAMKQSRVPQYEKMQYQEQQQYSQAPQSAQMQQLPEELQGQNIQQDYSQYEQVVEQPQVQYQQPQYQQVQVPQQMVYYPQQMQYAQPQPSQREIKPVFKSSGGKPYPAFSQGSTNPQQPKLTPSSQTIPYGYVETTDMFTGRRYAKKLPPTERWAGGNR